MDWVLITEADAKAAFTEYEWTALTDTARATGASALITTTISRVVNRVRGYVESCDENQLGAAGYVPALLYDSTQVLLLQALCNSFPAAGIMLDEGRRERIKAAETEMKMVARCELRISPPGSGQEVAADSPAADGGSYGGACAVDFTGIR